MIQAVSQWTGLAVDSSACQYATAFLACLFVTVILVGLCRAFRV